MPLRRERVQVQAGAEVVLKDVFDATALSLYNMMVAAIGASYT